MNNTKVIPARLVGRKQPTGAKIEALLLEIRSLPLGGFGKTREEGQPGTEIVFGSGR